MPGAFAYGNAAGNALSALQTGLNIGDEIKNGPADRQYILQARQADLKQRELAGQLTGYEVQEKARAAHIQAATDNLAKLYNDPKVAEYTPEQFAELTNHAGVPDNIGSPDFGQHLSTVMSSMSGAIDKNSPQALHAYNQVFSPQVNAAVGAVGDKGPIVGQKAAQIVPSATGGIHVDLQNTTADGSIYNAPATVGRGAHDDAPIKDVNPEEAIQHTIGLAQIHDDIQKNPNSPFAQAAAKWAQLPEETRTQLRQQAIRKQYLAVTGQIPPNETLVKSEPGYFITQDANGAMKVTPVEGNTGGEGLVKAAEDGVRKGYWGSVKEGLANLKGDQNLKVQVPGGSSQIYQQTGPDGKPQYVRYNAATNSMEPVQGAGSNLSHVGGGATAANAMSPEAIDDAAHTWIMSGAPPQGLGRSPLTLAAIANRKAEIEREKGDDASASASAQVANRATQHGLDVLEKQASVMGVAEKTATKNLDQIEKMAAKVDRTGSPLVNKLRNAWSLHVIQDPDLAALKNIVSETTTEYAKVMSGQTTGAGVSDAARAQTEKLLSVSDNPKAFAAEIATMRQAMRNRVDGTEQQRQEIMGRLKGNKPAGDQGGAPLNPASATPLPDAKPTPPMKNAKGWVLHKDAQGNQAYVGPNNEVEPVQ